MDATRQLRLRSVPPYLCLSLQRFVFDLKARSPEPLLPLDCPPQTHTKWSFCVKLSVGCMHSHPCRWSICLNSVRVLSHMISRKRLHKLT